MGAKMVDAFAQLAGFDSAKHKVTLAAPVYHWDLPVPRNRPVTALGLIADADARLGWTGDWCVDPSAEGCWLAGTRAGQTLANAILTALEQPGDSALAHALRSAGELLPSWQYYSGELSMSGSFVWACLHENHPCACLEL